MRILICFALLIVACCALEYKSFDYRAYPKYEFKYGVEDPHTKDKKERSEQRDGEEVKQEYTWGEKDREVKLRKWDTKGEKIEIGSRKY